MNKKVLLVIFGILLWIPFSGVFAQQNTTTPTVTPGSLLSTPCDPTDTSKDCYQLLEPLPTADPAKDLTNIDVNATGSEGGIGGFINFAMEIGIAVAGVLGVIMLVIYGFQYAANDQNVGNFEVVRKKITNVVLGLMLLLGITIILKTINPDLLVVEPGIGNVTLNFDNLSGDGGTFLSGGGSANISIPGALPGSGGRTNVTSIKNSLNQWDALLSKYAHSYGLDCTLLKAIMTQESKGVASAQSSAGAVGLMQIMPRNWGSNPKTKMFEPETNINVGAKVLSTLLKGDPCLPGKDWSRFSGCSNRNIEYVVAAYNGGYRSNGTPTSCGNTMTKWQCGAGSYSQTKDYVNKVLGYYNDLKSANMMCN